MVTMNQNFDMNLHEADVLFEFDEDHNRDILMSEIVSDQFAPDEAEDPLFCELEKSIDEEGQYPMRHQNSFRRMHENQSKSMPTPSYLMNNQKLKKNKWRMKYLSKLNIAGGDGGATLSAQSGGRSPPSSRASTSTPVDIPRGIPSDLDFRDLQSAPSRRARFPPHLTRNEEISNRFNIPGDPVAPDQFDFDEETSQSFVPPHQLVDRGCFSLGMQHHFRRKAGKI